MVLGSIPLLHHWSLPMSHLFLTRLLSYQVVYIPLGEESPRGIFVPLCSAEQFPAGPASRLLQLVMKVLHFCTRLPLQSSRNHPERAGFLLNAQAVILGERCARFYPDSSTSAYKRPRVLSACLVKDSEHD